MVWQDKNTGLTSIFVFFILTTAFAFVHFQLKSENPVFGLLFYLLTIFTTVFTIRYLIGINNSKRLQITEDKFIFPDGRSFIVKDIKSVCYLQAERILFLDTNTKKFRLLVDKRNDLANKNLTISHFSRQRITYGPKGLTFARAGLGLVAYLKLRKLINQMKLDLPIISIKDSLGLMKQLETHYPKNKIDGMARIYTR